MSLNKLRLFQNLLALSAVTLIITIWSTVTFLVYQNSLIKKFSSYSQNENNNTLPAENIPINNWKTYRNEDYGFELKYPNSWKPYIQDTSYYKDIKYWITIDEMAKQPVNFNMENSLELPWADWIRVDPKGLNIYVSSLPNVEIERTGYNCNLENEGCLFLYKYEQTTFKDIPARLTKPQWPEDLSNVKFRESAGDGGEVIPYSYLSFKRNGLYWTISYTHSDFKGNHNLIYDQILSTFKFVDGINTSPSPILLFTCPPSGWIDCMPGPNKPPKFGGCSQDVSDKAIKWYKANCPNYQGIAY